MKFERNFVELEVNDIITTSGDEPAVCNDPFATPGAIDG